MSPEEVAQFHDQIFVANVHADYSIEVAKAREEGEKRGIVRRTYIPKLVEGGIDFEFYTVGGDDRIFTQDDDLTRGTFRSIDHAYAELTDECDDSTIAFTTRDVLEAKRQGKRAFMLTIEGAAPIQEDISLLRNFYRLGLRSVCLTWFKANPTADGVGEQRNGGLSQFGSAIIREMNRLGMVIDISQCSPQSVSDVIELSELPVIASHSNAAGHYPHRRNLTDTQLKALARKGGLIGLTSYPAHVGEGRVGLEQFLDHFDYVTSLVGVEHIAVGLNIIVHTQDRAQDFYRKSDIEYADLWLPGIEDVDKMPAITGGLLERGYSQDDVEKIMGGNLLRLLEATVG